MTELFGLLIFSLFLTYVTRSLDLSFTGQFVALIGLLSLSFYLTKDPVSVLVVFIFFGLGSIIDSSLSEAK